MADEEGNTTTVEGSTGGDLKTFTAAEVARHNTKDSLWLVFDSKVYDVTDFLSQHPGGQDPLLGNTGIDATEAFEAMAHSPDAREKRNGFLIGQLAPGEKFTTSVSTTTEPIRTVDESTTTTTTQPVGSRGCTGGCHLLSAFGIISIGAAAVAIAAIVLYKYKTR